MVFLSNPWFIGIIGGIVSGLIVFYITTIVTKIYRRKEYYKSIHEVNLKVSRMLIMSISESEIPEYKVVAALLSSLAKRSNVELKDINNVEETYNDLIYELFETEFIPVEKKRKLANELIIKKEYSKIIISEYELQNEIRGEENLKFLPNRLEPLVISMLIILFSFVFVLLKFPEGSLLTLLSEKYKIVNISLATSTLVIGMLSFLTMIINTKDKKN